MLARWLFVLTLITWGTGSSAEATYEFVEPNCPTFVCGTAGSLYLDGEIGSNEAQRLETEILARGIPIYSTVYFNSPGGSLYGGMELGRVIRKYGLNTSVGKLLSNGDHSEDGALCYSACTLAFLGGEFRYFSDDASFGVHRFYSDQPAEDAEAMAQVASAAIITYLAEMGTETDFFVEMAQAGSETIKTLPLYQMLELGVANNGVGKTSWTVKAREVLPGTSVLYLKGERNTSYGINKVLFYCLPQREDLFMHVIFDPQGRSEEVQTMRAISIEIDHNPYPFTDQMVVEPYIENGWVNATFLIPTEFWAAIKQSNEFGIFRRYCAEA